MPSTTYAGYPIIVALALSRILSCLAQEAPHEFRQVNGVRVDLTPVIRWHHLPADQKAKTERPMPHWKLIHVVDIGQKIASYENARWRLRPRRK